MKVFRTNRRLILFFIFLIFNITLNAMKISNIKGTERLSNYNELKNIEVEREVDYDNYDRKGDYAYVKGEKKPVNGLIVARKNNKIIALIPYVNGNGNGKKYEYYENGKLRMEITLKNNIKNGNAFSYTADGKLLCKIQYKDDIEMLSECYYQDSSLEQIYKSVNGKSGILTKYYKGTNKKSYISEVIQDYSVKGEINYIRNGKTTVYEKNGNILEELNFNNGSLLGERQKLYKNGKVKYDFIGGAKDIKDLKAIRSYIEYFDNSDTMKYSCDEVSTGNWKCKEYSKDGSFKQNVDGRKYVSVNNNHHGNIWINIFLGAWNILNP